MASNQIPRQMRMSLDARMDSLFGRVLEAFPCPLGHQSRQELGWCNLDLEDVERVRVVMNLGVLIPSTSMHIFIAQDINPVSMSPIHLRMFGRDASDAGLGLVGIVNKPMKTSREHIAARLGQPIADQFFKWLDEAVVLSDDINIAMETYRDIMKIAKTAGHLRRMVSELYSLATGLNQRPLPRANAIPYEWSSYPRRPVECLTHTIAKCLLLPDSEATWSMRDQHTWPVIGES